MQMRTEQDEQELLKAINNIQAFTKKQEDQKKFNDYMNAVQDIKALNKIIVIILNCQQAQKEALRLETARETRKMHEKKSKEFLHQIKQYYEEKANASRRELEKNSKSLIQLVLEEIIEHIAHPRVQILESWKPEDRKDWEGNSWKEAVTYQAARYTEKTKEMALDYYIKNFIETQHGIILSSDEKIKLEASSSDAFTLFEEELQRLKQDQVENPMSRTLLQVKYAGLIRNMAMTMNRIIDDLNIQRKKENKPLIEKIDNIVTKATAFAKNAIDDIDQIMTNMQNFILLETLERQEKMSEKALSAENNIHSELKPASTVLVTSTEKKEENMEKVVEEEEKSSLRFRN